MVQFCPEAVLNSYSNWKLSHMEHCFWICLKPQPNLWLWHLFLLISWFFLQNFFELFWQVLKIISKSSWPNLNHLDRQVPFIYWPPSLFQKLLCGTSFVGTRFISSYLLKKSSTYCMQDTVMGALYMDEKRWGVMEIKIIALIKQGKGPWVPSIHTSISCLTSCFE